MNTIKINGGSVSISGRSVVIQNGRVVVDGKDVTGDDAKIINIEIQGNVESVSADVCNTISVTGSVGTVKTQSGDVRCGDVADSVKTMSGDITCGSIGGDASTMSGDISRR